MFSSNHLPREEQIIILREIRLKHRKEDTISNRVIFLSFC
jgi:hypothetical protein